MDAKQARQKLRDAVLKVEAELLPHGFYVASVNIGATRDPKAGRYCAYSQNVLCRWYHPVTGE